MISPNGGSMKQVSFRMEDDVYELLVRLAKDDDRSINSYLLKLVKEAAKTAEESK